MAPPSHAGADDLAERILACIESIPRGRVMTYGDVAEFVGASSPRIVGRVLALDDGSVPWHRVLRANGTLAEHLYTEQRQRLLAEGVRFVGDKVDLAAHRVPATAGALPAPRRGKTPAVTRSSPGR
jgi:methylated-DNA-protein-cysteine methyltransferase related protein